MIYKFICPKCGKEVEIKMSARDYIASGHYCECGAELKRDINDFCKSYKTDCEGFYGKHK